MMRETSLLAYMGLQDDLSRRCGAVLLVVKEYGPITNMEIASKLGWSINRVTPRVLELRKLGLVRMAAIRNCGVTGNHAIGWETT